MTCLRFAVALFTLMRSGLSARDVGARPQSPSYFPDDVILLDSLELVCDEACHHTPSCLVLHLLEVFVRSLPLVL